MAAKIKAAEMYLEWCARKWSLLISEDCEVEQWELDEGPCMCGDELAYVVFEDTPDNRVKTLETLKALLSDRSSLKLSEIEKVTLDDAHVMSEKRSTK